MSTPEEDQAAGDRLLTIADNQERLARFMEEFGEVEKQIRGRLIPEYHIADLANDTFQLIFKKGSSNSGFSLTYGLGSDKGGINIFLKVPKKVITHDDRGIGFGGSERYDEKSEIFGECLHFLIEEHMPRIRSLIKKHLKHNSEKQMAETRLRVEECMALPRSNSAPTSEEG